MANRNGIADVNDRKISVNAQEFSSHFSSKNECFRFLSAECGIYLDDFKVMSIFHLRDLISGNRRKLKSEEVKHIHVPYFDSLSVEKMLEWAKRHPDVFTALPKEQNEINSLHRNYIANVIYTIVGEDFRDWINNKMQERTKRLALERNMTIQMDPEIYKIYKDSTSISGKSAYIFISYPFVQSIREYRDIC